VIGGGAAPANPSKSVQTTDLENAWISSPIVVMGLTFVAGPIPMVVFFGTIIVFEIAGCPYKLLPA
jgi:hypothetical protein